ncbi:MAG: 3D domain-containing protein [Clostridia bacterium]|nr:3D domain-containing protein [Clostridia bacterium]
MLRSDKSGFSFAKLTKMRTPLLAMLLIAAICAGSLLFGTVNTFTVSDGKRTHEVQTLSNNVESAIVMAGFNSSKYKVLSVNATNGATHINLAYKFPVYITMGKKTVKTYTTKATVADILKEAGYKVDKYDMVEPSLDTVINDVAYIDYTNIDYVNGSYLEDIPYSVKTVYSDTMEQGTKTLTAGVNGKQEVKYTAKMVNGVKVETIVNSTTMLSAPVEGTQTVGTKATVVTTSANVGTISTLTPAAPIELDANGNPVKFKSKMNVQATAYTYTGNNCSTGVAPQPGYIAVNPRVIPYGTKMYIKTADGSFIYGYAVAADTGGFINSRPTNVDLFMASRAACTAFGRRNVEIYILE